MIEAFRIKYGEKALSKHLNLSIIILRTYIYLRFAHIVYISHILYYRYGGGAIYGSGHYRRSCQI